MSDAEENKPAEGSEPITIRVRDQVSVTIKKQQRNAVAALVTRKSLIAFNTEATDKICFLYVWFDGNQVEQE